MTAMGANSNVIVIYAAFLVPERSGELPRAALLLLIIGGLTFINYRGIKHGVTALMVFGVLKVVGEGLRFIGARPMTFLG
jgi:amino acid transporter